MTNNEQRRIHADTLLELDDVKKELACWRKRAERGHRHWSFILKLLDVAATGGKLGPGLTPENIGHYPPEELLEIVNGTLDAEAKVAKLERQLRDMGIGLPSGAR